MTAFPTGQLFEALLFDMDGTILTSIPAVERAWTAWARRVGVDAVTVLAWLHGRTALDTISRFAPPGCDIATEVAWLDARELADLEGIAPIAGAASLLASLPAPRWAVVTSANRALARRRITAAGLPQPATLIACDDVRQGKPHPEGYLLAAERLGCRIDRCLVFEDTGAGLRAGLAAGASAVRVLGTHGSDVPAGLPTIADYRDLRSQDGPSGLGLHLCAAPPGG